MVTEVRFRREERGRSDHLAAVTAAACIVCVCVRERGSVCVRVHVRVCVCEREGVYVRERAVAIISPL